MKPKAANGSARGYARAVMARLAKWKPVTEGMRVHEVEALLVRTYDAGKRAGRHALRQDRAGGRRGSLHL